MKTGWCLHGIGWDGGLWDGAVGWASLPAQLKAPRPTGFPTLNAASTAPQLCVLPRQVGRRRAPQVAAQVELLRANGVGTGQKRLPFGLDSLHCHTSHGGSAMAATTGRGYEWL